MLRLGYRQQLLAPTTFACNVPVRHAYELVRVSSSTRGRGHSRSHSQVPIYAVDSGELLFESALSDSIRKYRYLHLILVFYKLWHLSEGLGTPMPSSARQPATEMFQAVCQLVSNHAGISACVPIILKRFHHQAGNAGNAIMLAIATHDVEPGLVPMKQLQLHIRWRSAGRLIPWAEAA